MSGTFDPDQFKPNWKMKMSSMPNGTNSKSADDYGINSLSKVLEQADQPLPSINNQNDNRNDIVRLIAWDIYRLPLPIIIEIGDQLEKHKEHIKTDHPGLNNALMLYHWAKDIVDKETQQKDNV